VKRLQGSLPFLFALCFWASFHPLNLGFLGWVALIPLLVYAKGAGGWKPFLLAWLGGSLAFGVSLSWLWYTSPLAPFFVGLYKGLFVAAFVSIVRRLGTMSAPVAWVALECVRGHLLGGLPWFLLGYTQHEATHLVQIADLGGVWLVSALVAFVNAALVDGRRWARQTAAAAVALAFVYGALRISTIETRGGPLLAVVQPNIPQDVKKMMLQDDREAMDSYAKHVRLTREAAGRKPDLIVWPEAAIYKGLVWDVRRKEWDREWKWHRAVEAPARETGNPVLVGVLVVEGEWVRLEDGREKWRTSGSTNSAVVVDPRRGLGERYDKVHLVPFGEYIPFSGTLPFVRSIVEGFSGLTLWDTRAGEGFPVWESGGVRYGVQICFEGIFPEISRTIARNGAAFSVNISNDGWFRASAELDQMLAMARFRAIECRIGFVRATNTGISAFIDPDGRVTARIEGKETEGVLAARPGVTATFSLYRELGDWAGWGAVLALAAFLGVRIFVDRKSRAA
jgi:apolipoprotein N-acyltransferase